jgi:hypothetical protein
MFPREPVLYDTLNMGGTELVRRLLRPTLAAFAQQQQQQQQQAMYRQPLSPSKPGTPTVGGGSSGTGSTLSSGLVQV